MSYFDAGYIPHPGFTAMASMGGGIPVALDEICPEAQRLFNAAQHCYIDLPDTQHTHHLNKSEKMSMATGSWPNSGESKAM